MEKQQNMWFVVKFQKTQFPLKQCDSCKSQKKPFMVFDKKKLPFTKRFFSIFIKYKLHVRVNRRGPTEHANVVNV